MPNSFGSELRNYLLLACGTALIGFLLGFPLSTLLAASVAYTIYLLYRIHQISKWVHHTRRGIANNDDNIDGPFASIADDVALMVKRHEKEKLRLLAIVNRVQEMTMALNDGVILIDRKDNIEWWNNSAEQMFDFKEVDLGHKLTNLIRHPSFSNYFESFDYDEPLDIELSYDHERYLQFQIHLFGQNERLVIVRDITRMHNLERMRKDFVANVTHELRTPLTVIRGYLETLSTAPDISPVMDKAFTQMLSQSERMTHLINDLLTLTKLETDDHDCDSEPVNLNTLAQTVASDAKALSSEHAIKIVGDDSLSVLGVEKELHSALSNLVYNAINYSPKGSEITITVEDLQGEACIHIDDNGPGIDPKHIPRLTERFYRVDAGRSVLSGGTGLGLAIVKHILIRHNAELRIESQLGKGSRFSCYFKASSTRHHAA